VPGWPENITVENNLLHNASGPLVFIDGYTINVWGNMIFDHQLEPPSPSLDSAGGAIVIGACVANSSIHSNTIDDTNVGTPGADGMELHGIDIEISQANTMTNIPAEGIVANTTCGLSILGASITNANKAQSGSPTGLNERQSGGIAIETQASSGRTTDYLLISGTTVANSAAGVFFYADLTPSPFGMNMSIQNNCLSANPHVYLNYNAGTTTPPSPVVYDSGMTCPAPAPLPKVTCAGF
jgi:hypothetical protein